MGSPLLDVVGERVFAKLVLLGANEGISVDCSGVGLSVGINEGFIVGTEVGIAVGTFVGTEVGIAVGISEGTDVGTEVGLEVGTDVGSDVGIELDGLADGSGVGFFDLDKDD